MNNLHIFADEFFHHDLNEVHKTTRSKYDWTGFIVGFQCGPECPLTPDGQYAQYKVYMPEKVQYPVPDSLSESNIQTDLLCGVYQFIKHDMELHEIQEKCDEGVVWCFYGLFTRWVKNLADDQMPPGSELVMMPPDAPQDAKIFRLPQSNINESVSKIVDEYKIDVGRDDIDVFIGDLKEIWT